MKTRKDGEATRERILDAACEVFGEKGFSKATHAEICRKAGVNPALINFHFGCKVELYRAVWDRLERNVQNLYPMDGGVPPDADASQRLRGHVRTLVHIALDPRMKGFHRIHAMELTNPTGLIDEMIKESVKTHRTYRRAIIRELLTPHATERDVELCEMSVMSQCHTTLPPLFKGFKKHRRELKLSDVETLTDHITRFSLAGIIAIREGYGAADRCDEEPQK